MSKRLSLVLTTAVVGSLALVAPPALAFHSWNNYHWGSQTSPVTLKVVNTVDSAWQTPFTTAISDWDVSPQLALSAPLGMSSKRCAMVAGTVQVCNRTYGNNGWLGLASINLSGGHITQGFAKMNDTYFNTATYNNPN